MLKGAPQLPGTAPAEAGTVSVAKADDGFVAHFSGRWDVRTVMQREDELKEMKRPTGGNGVIDISDVRMLDTVGAIAIIQLRERWSEGGGVEIAGAHEAQAALLDQVSKADSQPIPRYRKPTFRDRVAQLGKWAVDLGKEFLDLLAFFGELLVVMMRLARNPRRLRITAVVHQMQIIGINATPIVGLLAFLIGIVLADLSADQLQRFGAGVLVVNLLGISILRELGIFLTAIMVAGRSGSAFTAEIGTMKINQEVDAMRTIGLDPMEVLVVPRILALMLILIPLGFFSSMIMLAGGAIASQYTLDISLQQFISNIRSAVPIRHFWAGVIKAPFFAFVIAMTGCYHGLQVSGSAESVGRHTTLSVVWSIFFVILLDAIFAVLFLRVGL